VPDEQNKIIREFRSKMGKLGGRARAAVLTKVQRTAIARKAAQARWGVKGKGEKKTK
jgi:hypothetical protein